MSQPHVSYSCGSCGYPLNLTSLNRVTSGIDSHYQTSIRKGFFSFESIDLSRFTQVNELNCLPLAWAWGPYRSKTKLLCRKCGIAIGYGYMDSHALSGFESPTSSYKKVMIKIRTVQPSEERMRTCLSVQWVATPYGTGYGLVSDDNSVHVGLIALLGQCDALLNTICSAFQQLPSRNNQVQVTV